MTREQFEHAVRAAGSILGVDAILVIGSQALHGSVSADLPPEALRSIEVDVAIAGDASGELADLIDGVSTRTTCGSQRRSRADRRPWSSVVPCSVTG